MYFKRLELLGFKSFFDKTILHFEPGVTAVVGPNGCGKSNIFDSVRWVLGEQSVKALRGSEMQDVIFNGTDSKEPLGMAEVTLALDNTNRFFAVDHDEVAITRRIFRSGESEYLLNKTQVRLKDIMDLLMGTGIGAESYSLVQQGKIDLVLSSKPEERRLVFDEASGITKYKSQKREALRKLEETDQNLLRVNDIITEVKRQIGSLERQANKARRYKEVFEELKAKEIKLAGIQKVGLLKQKDEIINSLRELEASEEKFLTEIKVQEAKINNRQNELKGAEDNIARIKSELLNLENTVLRSNQHKTFNNEKIIELKVSKIYLESQIEQTNKRIALDEEKLNKFKEEYLNINKNIQVKSLLLKAKEGELSKNSTSIKFSLEQIADTKRDIMEIAAKIANVRNSVNGLVSKQQILFARKKRLEIEKVKEDEEKIKIEASFNQINQELTDLEKNFTDLNNRIADFKKDLDTEILSVKSIDSDIEGMERQNVSLLSQKEFLGKLKSEYEGIGESMNAVIYLDKLPQEKVGGLVIKVDAYPDMPEGTAGFKLSGEAKPIDLNTEKIKEKIEEILHKIDSLKMIKRMKENRINELNNQISNSGLDLRNQEISLADKKAHAHNIQEQLNKIDAENQVINLELLDVENELLQLDDLIRQNQFEMNGLENEQRCSEEKIINEQNNISLNNKLKEENLVIITQTKTEVEALNNRINSDSATLKLLEDAYTQDRDNLINFQMQINDVDTKSASLLKEIEDIDKKIEEVTFDINSRETLLKESEEKYRLMVDESGSIVQKIDTDRKELDLIKNRLHQLQMHDKEVDYRYLNIKERLSQVYKIELDNFGAIAEPGQVIDEKVFLEEILKLKEKLDSYGTVNLVAIEEYDELKKRYDFLTQQQNDLVTAKNSLHEAILKINRTTKKMFLETFEQVRVEFRNFFRILFSGGDAQVFLIDENDPLESGIEIICRPPGKKLQNVLLLSGGEKSLSAIALIFAIFKVKPAPFCILDEIDAALDESNVDRFGKLLQEFIKNSQFIVITHNKKTIANADVMYGITMQESGVSRIVSVKFAQNKPVNNISEEINQPVENQEPVI
ncbi:MAG: AAA family ATPase [Candidatus Omnitrophota bacterium]